MECAVVAVPDDKWGERPKAFVTLKPGMKATEGEVIEFCRQHIAHFKCPAAVEFGDLPKTSTGKVQKFVLRDKEWKGQREADQLMAIEQQLTDTLTQAIRAKDTRTADVVRMLKTRLQERRTAKGFTGQVDDALLLDVIGAYRKQLQKALAEYEKLGERGAAQAAQLRFEIEFCERFLPRGLDVTALRSLVQERARSLGYHRSQAGRPSRRRRHENPQGTGRRRGREKDCGGAAEGLTGSRLLVLVLQ